MRNILKACLMMTLLSVPAWADTPGALSFGTDSGLKTIAAAPSAGTQIMTNDAYVVRSWIVNRSTWVTVYVASAAVNATTAAGFPVPPNTLFSPDGPSVPYWGTLFAVGSGTGVPSGIDLQVGVMRTK